MVDFGFLAGISWGTVFVSIGSSAVVNYFGISHELNEIRSQEIEREREQWYNKVVSLGLRLRREGLRLPYNVEVNTDGQAITADDISLEPISKTLNELFSIHTEAPPEAESEVLSQIEEMGYWYDNLGSSRNQITTTEIKDQLQQRAEGLIDEAVSNSDRYKESPY